MPCRNKNHCAAITGSLDWKDNGLGFMKLDVMIDDAPEHRQYNSVPEGSGSSDVYLDLGTDRDTLLPMACPGMVLSPSDTKEHSQVAPQEKMRDGEKG